MSTAAADYDLLPYAKLAHPYSHPERAAVLGRLFGMETRDPASARILEIGCAQGSNLLPWAEEYPQSEFLGIDVSPSQIDSACRSAQELGLSNVRFEARDLCALEAEGQKFDYIIAHGVYSWVAESVQDQLLAKSRAILAPMGLACISYNTLPGSAMRTALRQMLRFHNRSSPDLAAKLQHSRQMMAFLGKALEERDDPYAVSLKEELDQVQAAGDYYLAHEHLEDHCHACHFYEFMEHAGRHGLQFAGEAEVQTMAGAGLSPLVRSSLRDIASSTPEAEQYADFVRNRAFRQTLLCHREVPLKRSISPDRLYPLHIASSLQEEPAGSKHQPDESPLYCFRDLDGVVLAARDPYTREALAQLQRIWPGSMPFEDLLAFVEQAVGKQGGEARSASALPAPGAARLTLAHGLLTCFSHSRGLELHYHPCRSKKTAGEFPSVSRLAAWQARQGDKVTNLRHENVKLQERERLVMPFLDGRTPRRQWAADPQQAEKVLSQLARMSLLTG